MKAIAKLESSTNRIASVYLTFAECEAHGRSALYETLARGVAGDSIMLSFLAEFPPAKQQPNLLFAAVKYLYGTPVDWSNFQRLLLGHGDEIRETMMTRSTQTNEPARCATLLPLLARLPPPLCLLEVGAAAGLCLLPECHPSHRRQLSIVREVIDSDRADRRDQSVEESKQGSRGSGPRESGHRACLKAREWLSHKPPFLRHSLRWFKSEL